VDRASLKKFPRSVQNELLLLAAAGVRHRVKDGGHVILYPANGDRPFKVSANRPAKDTLRYLRTQFVEGRPRPGCEEC
jgi:hypothetical protein